MADAGPVHCRRELSVSPITQSAGGKGRASWPLGGKVSAKAGPKSSEAAVSNTSSSPKETVSRASGLGYK